VHGAAVGADEEPTVGAEEEHRAVQAVHTRGA
jgi:hypothetical protein